MQAESPGRDRRGFADDWRRLRELTDPGRARRFVGQIVEGFGENNLLTYASAISYQVLFALVPLALAGLALLGFLGLSEVWRQDIAPEVRGNVSGAGFEVIDATVERILGEQRGFWLTFGVAFALWQVSGAVRTVMGALNRVYGIEEKRPVLRRIAVSLVLALLLSLLLGLSFGAIQFGQLAAQRLPGGFAVGALAFLLRWGLAVLFILLAIGIVIRYAPARQRRTPWTGFGAVLVAVSWIVASVAFGWYATSIASYSSVFGSLATVIVLMTYLYLSSIVFLTGVQVDSLIRAVASGRARE